MRQMVGAGDDAADTEGRQERRHDARAEDARPALMAADVPVIGADVADVEVVVAAEELADKQHDDQEEEPERSDRRIDEHGLSRSVPSTGCTARPSGSR